MTLGQFRAVEIQARPAACEAMEAYQNCVTEQMHMSAEDGKRLFDDCQKITQKIAGAFNVKSNGDTASRGGH